MIRSAANVHAFMNCADAGSSDFLNYSEIRNFNSLPS
jgi:hypothetical protein